jgi:hypothetical protein
VFFDVLTDSKSDAEGLKSVLNQRKGHEILRVTVILSVLADERKLLPFVVLRSKNLPKENLCC